MGIALKAILAMLCLALVHECDCGPPVYLPRKRCEICVTVLMRKMAQVDHLCSGMESYFETVRHNHTITQSHSLTQLHNHPHPLPPPQCNDVVASMLHWYPNFIYWSWSGGCDMHLADGMMKRVRPCPAHAICGWLTSPNYHVSFCPWDANFKAPGLEDSLYPFAERPSDNMPPIGAPQGMGLITNMAG